MINPQDLQLHILTWPEARDCRQLRRDIFIAEQGIDESDEWDSADLASTHFLLADTATENTPIATARLTRAGQIGRLCVSAPYRRQGVANKLLKDILIYAQQKDIKRLFLNAQLYTLNLYQGFGFTCEGPVFLDAGLEHQRMTLSLS